ncbi:hypothetical protein BDY19DRAFT_216261 [Irpex rosettiformis]|uniref:Uncharacterized protein n=1 Tax=Irpex rosettiformis TaxID=378272 RepID=A0ACB8U1X0_9APHY|nr:hypothetical protein BDY19DRAFT_216261 [Irpex rosettiformis]
MSLQDGGGTNDLYVNPFAGSSQSSFSSAVKRTTENGGSIGTRPGFRRRGSESNAAKRSRNDHDPWHDEEDAFGNVHARSQTTDAVFGGSSSTKFHPLQGSLARTSGGSSPSMSGTDTRPRLKRLLSDLGQRHAGKVDSEDEDDAPPSRSDAALKEKVVIVHEVCPDNYHVNVGPSMHVVGLATLQVALADSLAGVALKYGISMADLRKANTLWPSDPIHIRKVLYIPLDRSHKAKEILLSQLEPNSTEVLPSASEDILPRSILPTDTDDAATLSSSPSLTIRRVPVSQLSFFPPPSTSLHPSSTILSSRTLPRSSTLSKKRDPIPFEAAPSSSSAHLVSPSSSLPSTSAFASALQAPPPPTPPRAPIPSLTSLFSALPIGRISYESNASTPSQGSDEQEHELDDVSRASSSRNGRQCVLPRQQDYLNSRSSPTRSKASSRPFDGFELGPFASSSSFDRQNGSKLSETPRSQRTIHYTSPGTNQPSTGVVRTSQPQPSPSMQLPLMRRRDP